MKVRFIKTGAVAEFNDSYGARLVEHGTAVLVREEKTGPPRKDTVKEKAAKAKKR